MAAPKEWALQWLKILMKYIHTLYLCKAENVADEILDLIESQ